MDIDAVARCGNVLAPAEGAAAGAGQPAAVAEDERAILAAGRLQDESAGLVQGERFHHVGEMILDLPFRNPQHLRQGVFGAEEKKATYGESCAATVYVSDYSR